MWRCLRRCVFTRKKIRHFYWQLNSCSTYTLAYFDLSFFGNIGLSKSTFKTRFANHTASYNNPSKGLNTGLSKHIWHLKDTKTNFKITWKILKPATQYNLTSNRCNLCLWEKYFIICKSALATLNKRNELITSCRHANKFLEKNFKASCHCHAIAGIIIAFPPTPRISVSDDGANF